MHLSSVKLFLFMFRNEAAAGLTGDHAFGLHVAERATPGMFDVLGYAGNLLGFSDTTAFHRAFRRWTGMTPGEYRRTRTHGER